MMKRSFIGRILHFYYASGRFFLRAIYILGALLLISLTLVMTVPDLALQKPGVEVSSNPYIAFAQAAVGIVLLGSGAGIAVLGAIILLWFWPEIIIELKLRKKVLRIIETRKSISLPDLAGEVGVRENELSDLISHWVSAKVTRAGKHLRYDFVNNILFWIE